MRRRSHTPLRRTVRVHHGQARLHHVGGEGGVPEDLLGDIALRRHRTGLREGHALRLRRSILLQPVEILHDRIDRRRTIDVAAALDRGADRTAAFHANAPFVDRQTVRNSLVAVAGHRQPGVGEPPAERRILLAVVHVTIDLDAVDLLDVVGEEISDVLIGRPVHGHAEIVAVLGLELGLDVRIGEPVVAEPVEVRELLVRQLIEMPVRGSSERLADEVVDVEHRIGDVLAVLGHPVRQVDRLAVTEVRSDEIGVVDPAIIDVLARLHLGLDLFHHVAFLDDVVLDLDAGDFGERLGQRLRLVFMRRQRLRDDVDFHALVGFGGLGEPFHFLLLVRLGQGRGLEFAVDPLLDRRIVRSHRRRQRHRDGDHGGGARHRQETRPARGTSSFSQVQHLRFLRCSNSTKFRPGHPDLSPSSVTPCGRSAQPPRTTLRWRATGSTLQLPALRSRRSRSDRFR